MAASTTPPAAQDLGGFADPDLVDTVALLEGLGDGILGGMREEDINNSPATRTRSKQSVAEQSPLALFQGFVSRKTKGV